MSRPLLKLNALLDLIVNKDDYESNFCASLKLIRTSKMCMTKGVANEVFVKEQFDMLGTAAYVAAFAGAVVGISGLYVSAKRFCRNRARDKTAFKRAMESFDTPGSDARLEGLNTRLAELLPKSATNQSGALPTGPSRTEDTDCRITARAKDGMTGNDSGKTPH